MKKFIKTYLDIDGTPFTGKSGNDTLPLAKETLDCDTHLQQTIRMGP